MDKLPPGTQRLKAAAGTNLVLAPQPNSDPNQPLNWTLWRKSIHIMILSFYTAMVFAILCVNVPLWAIYNEQLGMSYGQLNNSWALNEVGLSVGCIFFVPLAMKIGRRPIYIVTALIMLVTCVWQAKMNTLGDLYGNNIVMGVAACVNEALFQITVADLFFVHQRATMNGIYLASVMLGEYLCPVAAGYVAISLGWRWTFWLAAIFQAILCVAMFFFLEETKYRAPATISQAEVVSGTLSPESTDEKRLAQTTSTDSAGHSKLSPTGSAQQENKVAHIDVTGNAHNQRQRLVEIDHSIPMKNYWQRHTWYNLDKQKTGRNQSYWLHVYQPFMILATFPGVMFAALQYGWLVAMICVLGSVQATLYPAPPYNFSPAGVGNMNLPPAIGAVLGFVIGGPLVDYLAVHIAKRRGGIYEPETRLWLFPIPGLVLAAGAWMFGLTIANGDPWPINAVGAGCVGFAFAGGGDMALTYVQDSYQYILGDALTGVVFVRNAIATGLVFAITPWMTNMGTYNMFVLIGVITVVVTFAYIPILIWGRRWRIHFAEKYQFFAERQY